MTHVPIPFETPPVVAFKLGAVQRRLRLVQAAEGLLISASTLLMLMMLAMLIDELAMPIETAWRGILTFAALGIVGLVVNFTLIRPLFQPRRLSRVARHVEKQIPELQERWSTITELAESDDPPNLLGSAALIEHVAVEAMGLTWRVEARDVVSFRRVWYWAALHLTCWAIFASFYVISPVHTGVLMLRFWSPFSPITQTQITSAMGNIAVPIGEQLILEAQITGRLRDKADLIVRDTTGDEQHFVLGLSRTVKDSFRKRMPPIKQSFAYCWQSGDSRTPWYTVTADHRPDIAQSLLKITPPAYTRLPNQEYSSLPKQVRALRGSQLEVAILPSKRLSHITLSLTKQQKEKVHADFDSWYRWRTILTENFVLTPHLQDTIGLTNLVPPTCRIVVYDDESPKIEVISPEEDLVVTPDDTVKIEFKASDDFGIAEAELLVTVQEGDKQTTRIFPIDLKKTLPKKVHQTASLDLKSLALKEGTELTYAVRVRDMRAATATGSPTPNIGQASASQPALSAETRPSDESAETMPANKMAELNQKTSTTESIGQMGSGKPGEGLARTSKIQLRSTLQTQPSSSPPPNNMTRRFLDVAGSCCSKPLRLWVREWSGSFEGQARKKLQIAVSDYLNRLRDALRDAALDVDPLVLDARAGAQWNSSQDTSASSAIQQLGAASLIVQELKEKSANTPYAFVGLQLVDIDVAHITPARRYVTEGVRLKVDQAGRLKEFEQSAYHIGRARELLDALTRKFEAAKKADDQEETVKHIEKMHQLFIENMAALLKACIPALNSREGKWRIIPDELAAQILKEIEERLERKRRLMEALAKLLAEDPNLLRRFMANTRKSAHTLRDQLTVLARQQSDLRDRYDAWRAADPDKRKELLAQHRDAIMAQADEFALLAGQLYDNVVTWTPRGRDVKQPPFSKSVELTRDLAALSRRIPQPDVDGSFEPLLHWSEQILQMLTDINNTVSEIAALDDRDNVLLAFTARRTAETASLTARHNDWSQKLKSLRDGKYEGAVYVDQKYVWAQTEAFRAKMKGVAGGLAYCYTAEIGKKTDDMVAVMQRDITKPQAAVCLALRKSEWVAAQQMQANAVAGFAKAEKLFDDMLTAVEEFAAAQPVEAPTTTPASRPSFDQQLANVLQCLEYEGDACEKLGAVVHSNLMVQGDWMSPGDGMGSGVGTGTGGSEGQESGLLSGKSPRGQSPSPPGARQLLPPELQEAFAELKAKQADATNAIADSREHGPNEGEGDEARSNRGSKSRDADLSGKRDISVSNNERDWNVFVSKLEDELKQGHTNVPPEQYRQAISDYFRSISEAVSRSSTQPSADQ